MTCSQSRKSLHAMADKQAAVAAGPSLSHLVTQPHALTILPFTVKQQKEKATVTHLLIGKWIGILS